MSEFPGASPRKLDYHVTLEIAAEIDLRSEAITSHLLDAIFEMDDRGILLPGITTPRPAERLVGASVELISPDRLPFPRNASAAYERLMGRAGRRRLIPPGQLAEQLASVAQQLDLLVARQASFCQQLHCLAAAVGSSTPLTVAEKASVTTALQAANALLAAFETHITPFISI